MSDLSEVVAALPDKSLLLLDDDAPLRTRRWRRALETFAGSSSRPWSAFDRQALAAVKAAPPAFAVLDMRLEDGNGLQVVEAIQSARPDSRVIMLTGYGAISTAVAAVKAGAVDYLPKPADADDVLRALLARKDEAPTPPENPMSADRVRWEHIQRVYELCSHNVSETARRLNMHRRTLQRSGRRAAVGQAAPPLWGELARKRLRPSRATKISPANPPPPLRGPPPPAGEDAWARRASLLPPIARAAASLANANVSALRRAGARGITGASTSTAPPKPSATEVRQPGPRGRISRAGNAGPRRNRRRRKTGRTRPTSDRRGSPPPPT